MGKVRRRLLGEEITYSTAKEKETNVLHALGYLEQRAKFFDYLDENRSSIQPLAAHHLGLSLESFHIADRDRWIQGSFNVCIPIVVVMNLKDGQPSKRVIIRFPLPYRVGEAFMRGNSNEKIRCEAGTYA
jgi:hypothetical protein